ncbi:MAG: UTP--glucose-1-phosphate uridylyltransferase GalU [Deltaproteobacteria bacterium]|nr:UTP--glucose-1-phosphate uridylyltransferase GalU [Deltaproteobacteria bacterium]MBM4323543.1 UTP--glucose-1-phosphate uridylyltransferase GalU [Deltaproteobacteria bacterium]MBM4347063.1 UTP--glucose-1-phosphate uridylyltransferase GalU [Deltaproteobacteria bacterium]
MKVKKAVIPAAGFGTRFLPATKVVPKELLPIVDKPTIQYIMEEVALSGIEEVILITGREKGSIEDHFDTSSELENHLRKKGRDDLLKVVQEISGMVTLVSVRQKEPLGLGHAILCAKKVVGKEPFAVLLGDDLIDATIPCIRQMMKVYQNMDGALVAIQKVPRQEAHLYGIIKGNKVMDRVYSVEEMVEKPEKGKAPSNLAIIGRYILPPRIFDILERVKPDRRGEIQLTDGLKELNREVPIYGYEFIGDRYDAGDKFGYLQANLSFGLKHPEVGPKLKRHLKDLYLRSR